MTDKLVVIILDALDSTNVKKLGMDNVNRRIKDNNSEVLGVSSLPYTAQSNPLIWGGFENKDKFWVEPGTDEGEWSFPAGGFDREEEKAVDEAEKAWRREELETSFVWDDLIHKGVDASALHIPIVLPPYSFNTTESFEIGDHWFPHTAEQMRLHGEKMPETIKDHVDAGKDFIATSIQLPDKPLHAVNNNESMKEAKNICSDFDENFEEMLKYIEDEGYDWIVFGDHGSPVPGNIKIPEVEKFVPNHRKNSVIFSNRDDWSLPTYTDEIYGFIHEKVDVGRMQPAKEKQRMLEEEALETIKEHVTESSSLFMFTGGKEALVVSHMLEELNVDVPYGVIDTGNHFDSMYDFRNGFAEDKDLELVKNSYTELLEQVILNEDDPRGYHGTWDDDVELPENLEGVAAQNTSKEEWTVEASCGALKVHGVKQFVQNGYDVLLTGQRKDDATVDDSGLTSERSNPVPHKRVNPLFNWTSENVWAYIDKHDIDYPEIYDRGFNHTDAKCCTQQPNQLGEYGGNGVDVEKEQAKEKLQELGYI